MLFNNYTLPTSYTDEVYEVMNKKIEELPIAGRFKSKNTCLNTLNNIKNIEQGYFVKAKTEFTTKKETHAPIKINDALGLSAD